MTNPNDPADAARYRWLKDCYFTGKSAFALIGPTKTPDDLDAAIDAAIDAALAEEATTRRET